MARSQSKRGVPAIVGGTFDVVIVGAGPAGCAAALAARQEGLSVALLERETFPRPRVCAGWIGPLGVGLCTELGLTAARVGAAPIAGVTLHSWDIKKNAQVHAKDLSGWLVERGPFDAALLDLATRAGATPVCGAAIQRVALRDGDVRITLSGQQEFVGRVLLIADGAQSETALAVQLIPAGRAPSAARAYFIEYESPKSAAALDVLVGAGRDASLATIARSGARTRLGLFLHQPRADARQVFRALVDAAVAARLIAPPPAALEPVERITPAGVALDMESHVGKRAVLIGEAGGFVAAFSNEGIFPSMRSGQIAARTASAALRAGVLQDELAAFGSAWRLELADHLRMPNTDLSLLVPLVFGNTQMSTRVARAFLRGEAF